MGVPETLLVPLQIYGTATLYDSASASEGVVDYARACGPPNKWLTKTTPVARVPLPSQITYAYTLAHQPKFLTLAAPAYTHTTATPIAIEPLSLLSLTKHLTNILQSPWPQRKKLPLSRRDPRRTRMPQSDLSPPTCSSPVINEKGPKPRTHLHHSVKLDEFWELLGRK
ncbi:unnamed protein product [Sympodiomycopsis kandeliae]